MMQKIKSLLRVFVVQAHRTIDHLYRWLTGLPQMKRSLITPSLFLGGQYSLKALPKMEKIGVTAVVNMRIHSIHKNIPTKFVYLHLPTIDHTAPSIKDFKKGVAFIKNEINNGGKVYIHCRQGEGRGPSMAIAYLISTGITYEDAVKLILKVRPFIKLYPEQQKQLQQFEKLIHASK